MKNRMASSLLGSLLVLGATISASAVAGPYTEKLSECLVNKTTTADKNVLMNWMFAAMALNPSVAKYTVISDANREKINVDMATLVEVLITESCKTQLQEAAKYDGDTALQTSFEVFGREAARELFANPAVAKNMASFSKLIDMDKINAAMEQKD
jgi:hypothetical protein